MITRNVLQLASLSLLSALALCLAIQPRAAWAQSSSLDDAHVVPLNSSEQIARADVTAPALNAGVKPLRVNVDLVLVPVTVSDAMNRPILDLPKENFTLYESGVEQQIRYFSCEDAPISVALVLDYSDSMKNKVEYERQAVNDFFTNANPQDEYFVITVSSKPKLVASSTQSLGTIEDRLASTKPQGATALYDGIYLGINKLRTARYQRRAMVIVSDGGDNRSRYTLKEAKRMIEEANVLTYGIGIFDDMPIPLLKTIEERMGRKSMSEITDASGGRTLAADDRRKIPEIAAMISRELRNQYVLGYLPSNPRQDGKWRKIMVRMTASVTPRHVHYKEGYMAPLH
jgi:Ca-activated chloride channel family protein